MEVNKLASEYIFEILDNFNLEYQKYKNIITLKCPVHNGDNEEGCSIFFNSDIPNWKCFTHQCEYKCGKSLVSLIAAILKIKPKQAEKWICDFTGNNLADLPKFDNSLNQFIKQSKIFREEKKTSKIQVIEKLKIPSEYFVRRGFSPDVLKKFGVGLCTQHGSLFCRVACPIFDKEGKIVGYTGRTTYEKCIICGKFHHKDKLCPNSREEKLKCSKWRNSPGFDAESNLYNIHNAIPYIVETNTVIIVEGPPDIWKLYEAGIYNAVAVLGVYLKPKQKIVLEKLPILNMKIFLDPDKAGNDSYKQLEKELRRFYNLTKVNSEKDPGDCTPEELRSILYEDFSLCRAKTSGKK